METNNGYRELQKHKAYILLESLYLLASLISFISSKELNKKYDMTKFDTDYKNMAESVYNSMPSGHTAAAFSGLVMIGMLSPRIKWFTWTLAILIGVSSVYVGAHWVSDVVFGAFIGMVVADIVKWALKKINSK